MFQKREAECVISATDAKNNFGSVISRVAESGEPVVVERQGKGRAAIISMDDYRQLSAFKEKERRQKIWEELEQLRADIAERNKDLPPLSDEEIEAMVQEFRDDVMRGVVEKIEAERGGSIYS